MRPTCGVAFCAPRSRIRMRSLRCSAAPCIWATWNPDLSPPFRVRLLEVVFCNLHQPGKGAAVAHSQVGEHFAVDLHTGLAEAVHEPVVRHSRLAGCRVYPRDPEAAEVALAAAPISEGVG